MLNGVTWYPQMEALLPWFAGVTPSKEIHGAYSYPRADNGERFAESGLHAATLNQCLSLE
jgi:hypothetical protein